ncbi:hypothetical protein ACLI4Q_20205 [Natrialbaceae archaeon A-CW1-1]
MTTPKFVTERDLAQTFDGGAYDDAWKVVQQYRKATQYASKHNVGSGATANALDLPRSRIRLWIDGNGAPDVIRCINTARANGWLNVSYDDRKFTALNALVANVYSGGSIAEQFYQPSFALNRRGENSHVIDAIKLAEVAYHLIDDRDRRADEVRPTTNATTLGRVLVALGAPVGPKANRDLELPNYLNDAPEAVKRLFVVCYLENRAHKHNSIVRFREERTVDYLSSLAALIEDVSGAPVTISEKNIILSKAASEELGTGI